MSEVLKIVFLLFLFLCGAAIGSFLTCQARRLRLRETKHRKLGKRSVCLHCGNQLKWYDNIPIFSWVFLKGRCRKCGHKIGSLEILAEVLMGLSFLVYGISVTIPNQNCQKMSSASYSTIIFNTLDCSNEPTTSETTLDILNVSTFMLMLIFISSLGFLAIYDGAYGELPVMCLTFSIVCAIIIAILKQTGSFLMTNTQDLQMNLLNLIGAVGILGGVYFLLYIISKGKWVGDGDWLLGLALALALGDAWLALIALLIANLLALVVAFPGMMKKKGTKRSEQKIYFGPFLVAAFIIVLSFSDFFKNMIS